jgi:hypothetical protein
MPVRMPTTKLRRTREFTNHKRGLAETNTKSEALQVDNLSRQLLVENPIENILMHLWQILADAPVNYTV